ncbi:MAG: sigma-54-dependent Fis family transcriptional regulator [Deltaproteobacteria bacterium]|nr:sigma-54-dependent Fis family transcriptional regulator [Deltaproteobacteria bacterium]
MAKLILVVDDDALVRRLMAGILRQEGYAVDEASGGREGLAKLSASAYDLVLTDLKMPDVSGTDLLREGKKLRPETSWVLVTAYGSIPSAVEAVKAGASDYLSKPLKNPDELRQVVARVLREADASTRISLLSEELGRQHPPLETIFLGNRMAEVRRLVQEVAPTPATVLLTGPSGTGKELVARVLHQLSPRREKPFVAVHCAALAESVLESELFGHERGAFTGATAARKGRFELADGGTLFLDEIGELPPTVQVKLLRVLQEREFERVGGTRPISVDVRVVSATHRELKAEMAAGRFRQDLYYRLNVFPIELPRLSERVDAIAPLADYFIRKFAAGLGRALPVLSQDAMDALRAYPWPGNVRELQNVLERAVILSSGVLEARHLNLDCTPAPPGRDAGTERVLDKETITQALARVGGHRQRAADLLGISRRTLQYRIKEYGL